MSLHNWSNKKIITEDTSSYMSDQDFDIIEEARGKKIVDPLRAKLMGMEDIRDLKGTMTPRYFATKVIRYLQKENPEVDLENLTDGDIQNAINIMANVSKPLATRPDVKITTRERGAAKQGLKKGDTGFETLQLNLGGDTTLKSEGGVGENDLYTVVSDGLKYRVTLNSFKGQKLNLDDISKDDIVSVVIVKPSETEKVDKFGGEIEMGDREKLVADFPEGEEDGMSNAINAVRYMSQVDQFGMPTEDEIDYKKADRNKDGKVSEYELAVAKAAFGDDDEEDAESNIKFSVGSVGGQHGQIMHTDKTFDSLEDACNHAGVDVQDCTSGEWDDMGDGTKEYGVDEDTVIIMHVDKAVDDPDTEKKEKQRASLAHARAVADHYEDENDHQKEIEDERKAQDRERQQEIEAEIRASRGEEDAERCPVTGKLRKKKSESEEEEQVAMSQLDINNYLANQYRQKMQNAHSQERMYRHGY